MGTDVPMARGGSMSTVTTRSIANGAEAAATGMGAPMPQTGCTGMVPATTSASGADRQPMAQVVRTLRPVVTRSDGGGGATKEIMLNPALQARLESAIIQKKHGKVLVRICYAMGVALAAGWRYATNWKGN